MFEVDYDLTCLTVDELLEARARLHQESQAVSEHDGVLAQLFAALEYAVQTRGQLLLSGEERHVIAEALAIDEETGEWDAGA